MLEFTLNTDTLYLPQSWDETSFDQYATVAEVQADETMTELQRAARILSALTRIPMSTIEESGFGLLNPLWKHLDFTKEAPQKKPVAFVTIAGTNYYAQELRTFGELTAFDQVQNMFPGLPMKQIPYYLALLLRKRLDIPENKVRTSWLQRWFNGTNAQNQPVQLVESVNLDPEFIRKRAEFFAKHINPVQVMNLAAFFLTKERALNTVFGLCSSVQAMLLTQKANMDAKPAPFTGGWRLFTTLNRTYAAMLNGYVRTWMTS
ncbi:hypothetical protein I2I05_08600 [Hymenobacter sp. BT683]|uniref:Uncharacterized protein n=1 Tax=Hymenobacter jeongseonensis TaxID=2791027 RepID=A0ABS0IGG9_9BACT|nr:hypothetical protein [Hymenobacter jeongseonensis]MBF9237456.1 hypothetical protein [Hymenobacter jeongseonensis]